LLEYTINYYQHLTIPNNTCKYPYPTKKKRDALNIPLKI